MEENPLPNPVIPTDPVINAPQMPQPKRSNKKRIFLMVIFLILGVALIAGGAVAYKKSQDEKEVTRAVVAAKQKAANEPVKLLSIKYTRSKDKNVNKATAFDVKLTNLDGSQILSKAYKESGGNLSTKPDNSAALIISTDSSLKEHYRLFNKKGNITEVATYTPPAQSGKDATADSDFVGFVGKTNDFLLRQKVDDFNSAIVRVREDGSATKLLIEDKATYISADEVSPDGSKLIYEKISAKGSSCGGDEAESGYKIPDWGGQTLELRMLDLNTNKDELLIKDARKPLGTTEDAYSGLYVDSFSSDGKTAFMLPSGGGCSGGGIQTAIYAIDLESKKTSKITATPDYAESGTTTSTGAYRVYTGPFLTTDAPDESKIEILNLKTGKQQEVSIPSPFKNSSSAFATSNGAVTIDGKEKVILRWGVWSQKNGDQDQKLGILDVENGTFENMPISFEKEDPTNKDTYGNYCFSNSSFVDSEKLYVWSGCSFDSVDLKTKHISKYHANGDASTLLQ